MDTSVYDKIVRSLSVLDRDGILENLHGNCVLAADIIHNMLYVQQIPSTIVECQLCISRQEFDGSIAVEFVGYDFANKPHQISTHAVVMTSTNPPMIIDASIGEYLGNHKHVAITVCDKSSDPEILGVSEIGNTTLTYRNKRNIKLASFHQKDILDRLRREYDTLRAIHWLRIAVLVSLGIGVMNFVLNAILVLLKVTYL